MTIRRFSSAVLVVGLLSLPAFVQAQTPEEIKTRIDSALAAPLFKNAVVGVFVKSLKDGRTLYERNADFSLMPASNLKILTASTSAATLGEQFHFTTRILRGGNIDSKGELSGDLYIKGSGDPSLTTLDLLSMAKTLKSAGIKKFQGKIIADATVFDDNLLREGWEWDDEPFYYQAQVSGLNCDENVVSFVVKPGAKAGDAALIEVGSEEERKEGIAPTNYLQVNSTAKTGATGSEVTVSFNRARARNEVIIAGSLPEKGKPSTEQITMEEPALYTASRLWDCLAASGIEVPAVEKRQISKGIVPTNATMIAMHDSKPLPGLLADFLKPSDNLYGECLLKTLGTKKSGVGNWEKGLLVVSDFLKQQGVDTSGLLMSDGSGLSRRNNVTARLLVSLLTIIDTKLPDDAKTGFEDGLPVAGVDGTLRGRFKGTPAAGNLHAKTGSLTGVSSLSGYLTTKAGERLVLSILMNNFASGGPTSQARAAQDAIVLALVDTPLPK